MTNAVPRCLLFDLDGTLVDTDKYHLRAYNAVLAPLNRHIEPAFYKSHVMGFADADILRTLFPDEDAVRYEWVIREKEVAFRGMVGELQPTPGAVELLRWAGDHGLRRAVVTNAPVENADQLLDTLGLRAEFDTVVLGGELARGKPDPLPYLTALERLGCAAEAAAAFEDSLSGIRSATGAGIRTVGLTTSLDAETLRAAGAVFAVEDFRSTPLRTWLGAHFGHGI